MSESTIPQKYIEFCKAVSALASSAGFERLGVTITPGFSSGWDDDIQLKWEPGRHGEDSNRLYITSTVRIHTKIVEPPEPKP